MDDFEAAARRAWAVLPRNSGVFELGAGAARRFSARRTVPGTRGEKFFKNFLERGGKPKNGGARGVGRWHEGTLYRVCGAIFESENETSGSVARGAVRHQRFIPLIHRGPICKLHRSLDGGIPACPVRNSPTFTCGLRTPPAVCWLRPYSLKVDRHAYGKRQTNTQNRKYQDLKITLQIHGISISQHTISHNSMGHILK